MTSECSEREEFEESREVKKVSYKVNWKHLDHIIRSGVPDIAWFSIYDEGFNALLECVLFLSLIPLFFEEDLS